MKSVTVKILQFLLIVIVLVVVFNQVVKKNEKRPDTEEAILYTVSDDVSFDGFFVRNETVLPIENNGEISYNFKDGNKVLENSIVAEIYNDKNQVEAKNRISLLETELAQLTRSQNPGTIAVAQPDFLTQQIDEKFRLINTYLYDGNYEKAEKEKSDITVLMNIYNLVTGVESNYYDRISEINSEIKSLKSVLGNSVKTVEADKTGYFIGYTDGYENELNYNSISSLTPERINEIINSKGNEESNLVGKILDDYTSKVVGIVEDGNLLLGSNSPKLRIGDNGPIVDTVIENVEQIGDTNEYIVTASIDRLDEELLKERVHQFKFTSGEYTGLKVPRSAIRFNEAGEKGVYIMLGSSIYFRKIEVIYEGSDIIISQQASEDGYLSLYDNIILGGVDINESNVAQ